MAIINLTQKTNISKTSLIQTNCGSRLSELMKVWIKQNNLILYIINLRTFYKTNFSLIHISNNIKPKK